MVTQRSGYFTDFDDRIPVKFREIPVYFELSAI